MVIGEVYLENFQLGWMKHQMNYLFKLNKCNLSDTDFIEQLLNYKVKIDYKGNHIFRIVTHFGIKKNNIKKIVSIFKNILK